MIEISRSMGEFNVSIGTSVAIERLLGHGSGAGKTAAPYKNYQCLVANIRTLVRNYLSSYKAADLEALPTQTLLDGLISEIILVSNILADQTRGHLRMSIYNMNYDIVERTLPRANFKKKLTAKQEHNLLLERKLADMIMLKSTFLMDYVNVESVTREIKHGSRRNVLLTHYPVDFLFTSLSFDLLESHTGKIKKTYELNTKLKRAPTNAPFNRYTLQIYGDSSGNILPQASAIFRELTKILDETPSISPVTQDIKFLKAVRTKASPDLKSMLSRL